MEWERNKNYSSVQEVFIDRMGVSSLDDINGWYFKSKGNKYRIDRLDEAVEFLIKHKDERITIVGDYDADGCTSTAILLCGLREYGFKDVGYRIPRRFSEGFGINMNIIDEIDSGVILTCDNGIAAIEAIKKAKDKGLSVIVTDHHEAVMQDGKSVYPPADIIIDPSAIPGSADFSGYCGAGIAYRLICRLFGDDAKIKAKYAGLAAIGTIGDVMDLHEENYVIVRAGLNAMSKGNVRSGLMALIEKSCGGGTVTAEKVAFAIAPTLNALSRLDDCGSTKQVELLTFDGEKDEASGMAEFACRQNEARKELERALSKKADELIEKHGAKDMYPLIMLISDAHEGIVGITAGHLAEKYARPALLFTKIEKDGQVLYKGSARGCEGYDVKAAFDRHAELFYAYGGHTGAAGMTVLPENYKKLAKALLDDAKDMKPASADSVAKYDLKITEAQIPQVLEEMKKFEPYGKGNEKPVFLVDSFVPVKKSGVYRRLLGSEGRMIKVSAKHADAICFNGELTKKIQSIDETKPLQFIGTLSDNYYKGSVTHQVEIIDVKEKEGEGNA